MQTVRLNVRFEDVGSADKFYYEVLGFKNLLDPVPCSVKRHSTLVTVNYAPNDRESMQELKVRVRESWNKSISKLIPFGVEYCQDAEGIAPHEE